MRLTWWLVCLILLGTALYALAEDLTLTTYYPSPRGMYNELRTSGDVAIGTTSPITGAPGSGLPPRLYVLGTGVNTTLRIDNTTTGSELSPVVVNSVGDVGIGTTDPGGFKLRVVGTVRMDGLQLGTSATPGHVLTANAAGVGTWQAAVNEAPTYVGTTSATYDGQTVGGYVGGHAKCAAQYSGSHMCDVHELARAGVQIATGWVIGGLGQIAGTNYDCSGFGTAIGAFTGYQWSMNYGWSSHPVSCSTALGIACCR